MLKRRQNTSKKKNQIQLILDQFISTTDRVRELEQYLADNLSFLETRFFNYFYNELSKIIDRNNKDNYVNLLNNLYKYTIQYNFSNDPIAICGVFSAMYKLQFIYVNQKNVFFPFAKLIADAEVSLTLNQFDAKNISIFLDIIDKYQQEEKTILFNNVILLLLSSINENLKALNREDIAYLLYNLTSFIDFSKQIITEKVVFLMKQANEILIRNDNKENFYAEHIVIIFDSISKLKINFNDPIIKACIQNLIKRSNQENVSKYFINSNEFNPDASLVQLFNGVMSFPGEYHNNEFMMLTQTILNQLDSIILKEEKLLRNHSSKMEISDINLNHLFKILGDLSEFEYGSRNLKSSNEIFKQIERCFWSLIYISRFRNIDMKIKIEIIYKTMGYFINNSQYGSTSQFIKEIENHILNKHLSFTFFEVASIFESFSTWQFHLINKNLICKLAKDIIRLIDQYDETGMYKIISSVAKWNISVNEEPWLEMLTLLAKKAVQKDNIFKSKHALRILKALTFWNFDVQTKPWEKLVFKMILHISENLDQFRVRELSDLLIILIKFDIKNKELEENIINQINLSGQVESDLYIKEKFDIYQQLTNKINTAKEEYEKMDVNLSCFYKDIDELKPLMEYRFNELKHEAAKKNKKENVFRINVNIVIKHSDSEKLAILLLEPKDFAESYDYINTGKEQKEMNYNAKFNIRLLFALGWKVITIPYFEWNASDDRLNLILNKLITFKPIQFTFKEKRLPFFSNERASEEETSYLQTSKPSTSATTPFISSSATCTSSSATFTSSSAKAEDPWNKKKNI